MSTLFYIIYSESEMEKISKFTSSDFNEALRKMI